MPPYFAHNCVTYYSPSYGLIQLLYAFATGAIVSTIFYEVNLWNQKNTPLDNNNEDAARLKAQIVTLENQLARAFHVIVGLLIVLWLFFVFVTIQSSSGLQGKTEL